MAEAEGRMAEGVDDIVEYTVFGSKIGLVVRGFFDSTPPSCLIIRTSQGGPLNLEKGINAGDQLVSIDGRVIRGNGDLRWNMHAPRRVFGIRHRPTSSDAQDFTREQLIAIYESAHGSGCQNNRRDADLLLQLNYTGVPQKYGESLLQQLFPIFQGHLSPPFVILSSAQRTADTIMGNDDQGPTK